MDEGCDCVVEKMRGSRDVLVREHVGLDGRVEGRWNGARFALVQDMEEGGGMQVSSWCSSVPEP